MDGTDQLGLVPRVSRGKRISLWLIFVGLVAVASSLITLLVGWLGGSAPTLNVLLAEGDGFLMAIAITADGLARAIQQKKSSLYLALACGGVFVISLVCFGVIKTQLMNHKTEVEATLKESPGKTTDDKLKEIQTVLHKVPYKDDRVEQVSLIVIGAGLFTSFMIVLKDDEGN